MISRARVAVCMVVVGTLSVVSQADISWFNTPTNRIANSDGITVLTGDTTGIPQDGTISCFVQLIWAGENDGIDPASTAGNGVTGDDKVFAVGFIAQNTWVDGYMTPPTLNLGDMGEHNYFYVRAWNTNSPSYTGNTNDPVPSGPNVYYGTSVLWRYTYSATEPSEFNFGGAGDANNVGWSCNLSPIPEPTIAGLGLLGALALRMARKRRTA